MILLLVRKDAIKIFDELVKEYKSIVKNNTLFYRVDRVFKHDIDIVIIVLCNNNTVNELTYINYSIYALNYISMETLNYILEFKRYNTLGHHILHNLSSLHYLTYSVNRFNYIKRSQCVDVFINEFDIGNPTFKFEVRDNSLHLIKFPLTISKREVDELKFAQDINFNAALDMYDDIQHKVLFSGYLLYK